MSRGSRVRFWWFTWGAFAVLAPVGVVANRQSEALVVQLVFYAGLLIGKHAKWMN